MAVTTHNSPTGIQRLRRPKKLKAANKEENERLYGLGVSYEYGQGVKQDYGEAVKWYYNAAANGNELAKDALHEIVCRLFSKTI